MKKASKEAYRKDIKGKMLSIGNTFVTKCEVSVVSTIIDNLSLPNEQFYEICSQLNEGQQHLFNFIMQHTLRCILAEKNNELLPISNIFKWRCWRWKKLN